MRSKITETITPFRIESLDGQLLDAAETLPVALLLAESLTLEFGLAVRVTRHESYGVVPAEPMPEPEPEPIPEPEPPPSPLPSRPPAVELSLIDGGVRATWAPVTGATYYEVMVSGKLVLTTTDEFADLALIPSFWTICVRAGNAVGISTSRCASITVPQVEPEPELTLLTPNEPEGFVAYSHQDWSALRDHLGRRWDIYNSPTPPNRGQSRLVATLAGSFVEARYPAGAPNGYGAGRTYLGLPPNARELYFSTLSEVSPNWVNHPFQLKWIFFTCGEAGYFWIDLGERVNSQARPLHARLRLRGNGLSLGPHSSDGEVVYQNVQGPAVVPFVPGRKHMLELYVRWQTPGQSNGACYLWQDGELIVKLDGIRLPGSGVTQIHHEGVYGGAGSPVPHEQYWRSHFTRISLPGASGSNPPPVVVPPSPPVLPPPAGVRLFPNMPAGFRVVMRNEMRGRQSQIGGNWFGYEQFPNDTYGGRWTWNKVDASNPAGTGRYAEMLFPKGLPDGKDPARVAFSMGQGTEVFIGDFLRFSENFEWHNLGIKIMNLNTLGGWLFHGGGGHGFSEANMTAPALSVAVRGATAEPPGLVRDEVFRHNRATPPPYTRGQWVRRELYLKKNTGNSRNGIIRLWLDGVLVTEYTQVDFGLGDIAGWGECSLGMTWGGGGRAVREDQTIDVAIVEVAKP